MIEIIVNIIECLMLSFFLVSVMNVKGKKVLYFITLLMTSTTIITLSNYISIYDIFLTSFIILVNVIVSYIFVDNEFSEIVFYCCFEALISAMSNTLAIVLVMDSRILLIIISKCLYFILVLIVLNFIKQRKPFYSQKAYFMLSIIMFGLQFVISNFLQLYLFFLNDYPELKLSFIVLFICIVGVLFLLVYISDLYQTKQEYEILKNLKENDEILSELYNEIKITKHDLKHAYEMLNYYLNNKEYSKLSEYINNKQEYIHQIPVLIHTNNDILNMILNNKIMKAYSHKLIVECEILCLENLFISDYDINELLSNAFDNAIENNIDEGYIKVKIIQENAYIYISIKNSTNNKTIETKKNKSNHGFGLKSIRRICDKYNGNIEISLENNEFEIKMTLLA